MADDGLTRDAFLGGRLRILQPARGYRAGADAVFLAAGVPAKSGQTVVELGCGVGVASLCLASRVPGLTLAGVERDPATADIARRNAEENGVELAVITADLAQLPAEIRERSFDHVMMNPPFFRGACRAVDEGRAAARHEDTPLETWIDIAIRRLAPGGHLTLVHRTERLPAILAALEGRLGGIEVRPLAARAGRSPERLILTARKGARAPFTLHPALILHGGDSHDGDRESYSVEAQAILRDNAALR